MDSKVLFALIGGVKLINVAISRVVSQRKTAQAVDI